ncbi:MAG: hypothetical protein WA112_01755 [Rugosibacter sp.]|nr:hypothetical protein [Rugosibacter sp.]
MLSSPPSAMVRYHEAQAAGGAVQATALDRRRIERALEGRVRYRYVTPQLAACPGGYRILSPCCSRNVDPLGGTIDIARLERLDLDGQLTLWRLYSKNHASSAWVLQAEGRLHELLDLLKADPGRVFWQ